jgi:tetratricopeptide (TPR) repeat protein
VRIAFIIILLLISYLAEAQSDSTLSIPSDPILTKEEVYNRGLVYYKAEQFSQAILTLDSCLEMDSTFTEARFLKALSLEKSEDFTNAFKEFERINKESPGYHNVDKRLKSYYFTVYLSKYWYYMLAILFVTVLIITLIGKSVSYRKSP